MAVSGGTPAREPAVALVTPAGSVAPAQPATEPDTSTANTKPHALRNGRTFFFFTFQLKTLLLYNIHLMLIW